MIDKRVIIRIAKIIAASGGAVLLLNVLLELKKLLSRRFRSHNGVKPELLTMKQLMVKFSRHLGFVILQILTLNVIKRYSPSKLVFPLTFASSLGLVELFSIHLPLAIPLYVTTRVMVGL